MKIIFQDEHIIVCIKPESIISQSESARRETMISLLKSETKGEIFPVHRLDKQTAGLMVFAKTKAAAAFLSAEITSGNFKKEYLSLVHGKPQEESAVLKDLLFKDSTKNKSYVVKRERKGVKKASLEYELINTISIENKEFSIVKVLLHTGRTHQIRVQFASRGLPLVGDRKYGAQDSFDSLGLWSYSLTFHPPETKEEISFKSEPQNVIKDYIVK